MTTEEVLKCPKCDAGYFMNEAQLGRIFRCHGCSRHLQLIDNNGKFSLIIIDHKPDPGAWMKES
jgi:hypothetical protein